MRKQESGRSGAHLASSEEPLLLQTLETSASRGADLVKQVLSFARGTEGERRPIEIKRIILEVERIIKETL